MNILIISYYYPPCNSVGAFRIKSFAENWALNGNKVTIVTRHWGGNENSWDDFLNSSHEDFIDIQKNKSLEIHYLPYIKPINQVNRFEFLIKIIKGEFNIEIDTHQFKPYIGNLLKSKQFDLIFCSSPPLNIIKLGYELHKYYNTPWVVDLRDYENRAILKKDNSLDYKNKIALFFKNRYIKKWLSSTLFFSTVTEAIANYLATRFGHENSIIYHGFDESLIKSVNEEFNIDKISFNVSTIGSIYPEQNLDVFLDGIEKFITETKPEKFKIYFVGTESIKSISEKLNGIALKNYIETLPRVSHKRAIEIALNSQVLFYPGWKGYRGVYSGKIFEYLGLKRNILIAPGDDDVLDKLILNTNTGKIANTKEEVCEIISKWYKEWKQNGSVEYFGKKGVINEFSRVNQANKLLKQIYTMQN